MVAELSCADLIAQDMRPDGYGVVFRCVAIALTNVYKVIHMRTIRSPCPSLPVTGNSALHPTTPRVIGARCPHTEYTGQKSNQNINSRKSALSVLPARGGMLVGRRRQGTPMKGYQVNSCWIPAFRAHGAGRIVGSKGGPEPGDAGKGVVPHIR